MELQTVKLDEDGRIRLPQSILQQLNVMPTDELLIFRNGDEITLKKILSLFSTALNTGFETFSEPKIAVNSRF